MAYLKMQWDSRFGMMIFAPPPFNVVSFLFTPFLLLTQKYCPAYTERLNGIFTRILFFFLAVIMFVIFTLTSVLLIPLAYLKGLILYPKQARHI